jgi:hypothetical protein
MFRGSNEASLYELTTVRKNIGRGSKPRPWLDFGLLLQEEGLGPDGNCLPGSNAGFVPA